MLETCYIARLCLRLWVTSSCIIILIHQQWNRLHHKAAKSVLWLGFWILFWEVINYDVQKILTSRLVKIETWTIWTYSILLLTKMSYFCTIESVIKNVTDQKQTSKIFMLFILIWHHPSPELMTGLPHLTMICFRGHQWWIVSTCHLPSAAVSGCMQSVSAALVIGDPVLQCVIFVPADHQWSAVIVTLSVVLQCQWSPLLQYCRISTDAVLRGHHLKTAAAGSKLNLDTGMRLRHSMWWRASRVVNIIYTRTRHSGAWLASRD